jgi:hypothetical protein
MRYPKMLLALGSAAALAACAGAGPPGAPAPAPARRGAVITHEEIVESRATSAFHALLLLRGTLLGARGPTSYVAPESALPSVYVDGVELGTIYTLRGLPASDVEWMRVVPAWDATTRFGGRHLGGVIEVVTRH